jgi:DNA invertase Pin-like site-specific DNA recombinase
MASLTTQDLLGLLKGIQGENEVKDITQYRYAIYARKSSESEERQIRSLGDQIVECEKLAENKGLTLLKRPYSPIEEKQSAKEPDIRPKFRQMLEDIKKGKYDGIIAWHPDRLARNMKDAGEIIDLIDKQIIKDLQFVSFTFENSTAGKMLLGISFVLSKQYSDKLSDDVKRGMRRSAEEGKYLSKAKHGYYRDRNQLLRPDGKYYVLLKKAWQLRLEGKTQEEIAKYVNKEGYQRSEGLGEVKHKPFNMTNKLLSEIFRDTFYTGVLKYGDGEPLDLTDIYEFVPMVFVEDYLKINRFSDIKKAFQMKQRGAKRNVKADFLRKIVYCGHCGNPMSTGVTVKYGKSGVTNYFNFRCDTKGCKIKLSSGKKVNQNVRAKVILDFVYQFLEQNKFGNKKAYEHYLQEMKMVGEKQVKELDSRRKSIQQSAKQLEERIGKIKDLLLDETDDEIKKSFKEDLKVKERGLGALLDEVNKIKEAQLQGNKAIITYSDFVELFNNLPDILRQTKTIEG